MPNIELERTDPFEINPPESTADTGETDIALTHDDDSPIIGTGGLPVSPKDIRHLCRHIFADGRRCGSPALKTQNFCYYHYTHRAHSAHGYRYWLRRSEDRLELLDGLDNPTSIQLAITTVAARIAAQTIDSKRAGLLLYALQLASKNLRNIKTTQDSTTVPNIVEDFTWGHLSELEPGRSTPETLESRLKKPNTHSKPFTGYYPDYEIPEETEETIRWKEGLSKTDPLFPPERKTRID
jgi:hypothetical protein